jgi:catechol 2,3-dioxygenase-like lactoylglutathione lyase family enzyme
VSAAPRAVALWHSAGVKLPLVGVRQIKLPVSDLAISARWYADLFGLELANEFFEAGAVRGVVLADHEAGFVIGLRERGFCASSPVLDGFDVCAFMLRTAEEMSAVIDRCAELGIDHDDVDDRGDFGIAMDIADPDGTVLRFVAGTHTGPPGGFAGIEFGSGPPIIHHQPRLHF